MYPLFCYIFWGQFLRLEPIHNIKTNTISNGFDTIVSKGSNNTGDIKNPPRVLLFHGALALSPEVQKVVNPVILDDRKYVQNQGFAENISKT